MALVNTDRCESCGRLRGERHKATMRRPSILTMTRWMDDGVAKATDGCRTEPDGVCEHGHKSWLLRLGYI